MSGWTAASIVDQRKRFIEASRTRINEAREDLKVLSNQLWQTSFLRSIARTCHQLAGSSGFFDMPQFSRAAGGCERIALELLRKSSDLTFDDVQVLARHLDALAQTLSECEQQDQAAQQVVQEAEQIKDQLVLLCSDPRLSLKLQQALEQVPYSLHVYRGSEAALAHVLTQNVSALIVVSPVADKPAWDLIAEFRRKHESKPVLLLSQHDDFLDRLNLIRLGIDGLFEAPFDFDAVVQRLTELSSRDATFMYRVLSVEDDPIQSEVISSTLQSAGYAVLSLLEHRGFEEAVISFKPDLILLDVDLGEVSGFDLARYIRKIDRLATIPIIFLTTRNQLDSYTEGARSGGDEYLVKPASTQYLIATITSRIERYRAMQRLVERDGLTRLYTYSNFLTRCQEVRSDNIQSWMICFDIDGLGSLNNRFGLAAGDRAIAAAAKIIRSVFRQTDFIGRTSGGEISLLIQTLDERTIAEACQLAIQQIKDSEIFPAESDFVFSMSAGVAPLIGSTPPIDGLNRARSALKVAKRSGGASVVKLPVDVPSNAI